MIAGNSRLQSDDEGSERYEAAAAPQQCRWEAHGALLCLTAATARAELDTHSAL